MWKFKGKEGEFVTGVPARDLTEDEVKEFGPDQKSIFEAHMKTDNPIYEQSGRKADKDDKKA